MNLTDVNTVDLVTEYLDELMTASADYKDITVDQLYSELVQIEHYLRASERLSKARLDASSTEVPDEAENDSQSFSVAPMDTAGDYSDQCGRLGLSGAYRWI